MQLLTRYRRLDALTAGRGLAANDPARCRTYRRCFGPGCVLLAWTALLLAAIHPPNGLGFSVCLLESTTGTPCPGCGLTRSVSCTLRGDLTTACQYHPFGPLFAILFAVIAITGVLPRAARTRLATAIARRERLANRLYCFLVGAFLAYGVARALVATWASSQTAAALR